MPPEEHILWCAHVAERYLGMGWTSCVGAATAKPRLDVVIRNAIESGQIKGPRYLAASQEITVPGGLADETLPHLPFPEFSFGVVVRGADDMRAAVRQFLKYGVASSRRRPPSAASRWARRRTDSSSGNRTEVSSRPDPQSR